MTDFLARFAWIVGVLLVGGAWVWLTLSLFSRALDGNGNEDEGGRYVARFVVAWIVAIVGVSALLAGFAEL